MNNYEFLSYKTYPRDTNDQKTKYNPIASATVRVDRKYILTYILNSFGDQAPFWQEIGLAVTEEGKDKKTFLKGCLLDSSYEKEQLISFIKDNVDKYKANCSVVTQSVASIANNGGGVSSEPELPF